MIDKYRQQLNRKIEETLARVGQEWSAQAVELHVLRADAENLRKEGRGFYKIDENNIQTPREDPTEEYYNLVKSHIAAIEQLLEEFNVDQMMFRLEAEAYEEERLAAIANIAPTTGDHEVEPTTTNTTGARQEGPALANSHITPNQRITTTNLPEPEPTQDAQCKATTIPDSTTKPPSPTPPPSSLTNPILEED